MAGKNEPEAQDKAAESKTKNYYYHKPWLVPALIAVVVIVIIGAAVSWVAFRAGRFGPYSFRGVTMHKYISEGARGGMLVGPNNNQIRLQGVVTNVSGNTFTIAGDGSTNTVQTSSSTQYQNGSQVKVDDTVLVYGTTSSSAFTADTVVINP